MNSDCHGNLFPELVEFIVLHNKIVNGEIVKILDVGIEPNLGSLKGLLFHYPFDKVDVAVINVSVGDDVNKFAGSKPVT